MYEDNDGAKALAEHPTSYHRSKLVDVRFPTLRRLMRSQQRVTCSYEAIRVQDVPEAS